MPDLLLELFSEEIPARMQAGAARDLERLMVGALTDRGYLFEGIKAFAGPRRLTLAIAGLPAKQNDVREELKGPKSDAPQAALDGFLKKTGLTKDQLKVEKTPKGDVYMAVVERKGRETPHVLAEIIPEVMAKLPWPKSMRWKPGLAVRWVRPLHSILCTFDGELVPFSFAGISSGLHTRGHRFLSEGTIEAKRFDDYAQKLKAAHVVLEAEERAAIIFEGVKQAAFVHGLEMIPDEGLLAEVSGLAEWPVVYIGTIQDEFMDVPAEILQTSMRTHQKYFSLRDPQTGKMANRFALVANMIAKDGGKEIVAGNERVLRARLSDAKFFWDEDRKHSLESRVEKLKGIVFHAKLGTQFERVEHIEKLAGEIAGKIGADVEKSKRAAKLAKADLTTGVVGEFPELQGVMGRYYALHDKEDTAVADAIRDHYKPVGPSDAVPSDKVTIAVALADKFNVLTGFFAEGEKPTGSGDPFGLRRATLGAIRIILDNSLRLPLLRLWGTAFAQHQIGRSSTKTRSLVGPIKASLEQLGFEKKYQEIWEASFDAGVSKEAIEKGYKKYQIDSIDLLSFFADRLKVALKEKGVRHDLIDAVFSLGHEDDLVRLVARVEALQAFLKSDDGANLLAGYKRGVNILKLEEKKDGKTFISEVSEKLLTEQAEKSLFAALAKARAAITAALAKEDFVAAMQQMAALRVPVDSFFEGVKVNADDKQVRENRLRLLASLRATLHQVADFSRIEG
ncbi:MAG TPA: glycine--tRNA ligase subunit beta [Rhizomicrobium sp.]|nr:glycine--tRNA ligase subunit beta [Rhizomicrobium sp.]